MKPLDIPIEEFLRPFFDAGETVCLRVFDDKKTSTFRGQKLECEAGKIAGMVDTLKKHNSQNRGIYFVINYGGHDDTDITRINAQFVECDSLSIEEQLTQIAAFPVEPSLIIKTKKSLHVYWLMKAAKVEDFRRVQKRLVAQFNGDPACINESRVFRLPGFNHCKAEPVLVECIKFSPELRYTQTELEAVLPKVDEEPPVTTVAPKGTRRGLSFVGIADLILRDKSSGGITVIDHKSKSMTSMKKDLDTYRKQLYVYAAHVKEKYGEYPEMIRFNMFRDGVFIDESFSKEAFSNTMRWIEDTIDLILLEDEWKVSSSSYFCQYVCGVRNDCPIGEEIIFGKTRKTHQ